MKAVDHETYIDQNTCDHGIKPLNSDNKDWLKLVQENTHRAEITTEGLDSAADWGLQDSQLQNRKDQKIQTQVMAENANIFWHLNKTQKIVEIGCKFNTHNAAAGTAAWDVDDGWVTLEGKELVGWACEQAVVLVYLRKWLNNRNWIILLTEHLLLLLVAKIMKSRKKDAKKFKIFYFSYKKISSCLIKISNKWVFVKPITLKCIYKYW